MAFVGHTSEAAPRGSRARVGASSFISLRPTSSLKDVVWARLAAHVAATSFSALAAASPMAFFATVATSPDSLGQGKNSLHSLFQEVWNASGIPWIK